MNHYEELLEIVRALRAHAERAKSEEPREAERIEAVALDAMEAVWKLLPEQRGAP
mgnify:CR=1 FL=1